MYIKNILSSDETDYSIPSSTQAYNARNSNLNEAGPVQLKLLCGADLLESFGVPGLWKPDDVSFTFATCNCPYFLWDNIKRGPGREHQLRLH